MANAEQKDSGSGGLSLAQLVALNDEIAALARAGLPMERGLRNVGRDVSGKLSEAMLRLSNQMEQGASLPEALATEGDRLPTVYRAVVEAGIRAGRLPAALEALSGFIRGFADARRAIGLAMAYPLIVLIVAYTLLVLLLTELVPLWLSAFDTFRIGVPGILRFFALLGENVVYWGPILPVVLLLGMIGWAGTGRASNFRLGGSTSPILLFPSVRSLLADYETASFSGLLGLMVEHGVPLPEAIELASAATGSPRLAGIGKQMAAATAQGGSPAATPGASRGLPPLLLWLFAAGHQHGQMAQALAHVADVYRQRASYKAERLKVLLPTVLLLGVGMTATLLYALTFFIPFAALLTELSAP